MTLLEERSRAAARRLASLRSELETDELGLAERACVYVSGSFGRMEASSHSDLDLFIVGLTEEPDEAGTREPVRLFPTIEEALLKADLIRAARRLSFPEFDRDGEFLTHHSLHDLVRTLGQPRDDVVNTFTARLLLLLESQALLEEPVYDTVINNVIDAYWIDYDGNESDFLPAFLANDILRLWRTFCVNYEAFTKREPEAERAKRRLKNYKLRHSRLLTCYSALAYLLETYRTDSTVRPDQVREMVRIQPTDRLLWLSERHRGSSVADRSRACLELYEGFLRETDAPKDELIDAFQDSERRRSLGQAASRFGDEMFGLLTSIDSGSKLYRLFVI